MKHSTSTCRFLCENVNKGYVLGMALTSVTSSLALMGAMALFKEIEQSLDPLDLVGKTALVGLIKQVELKIKEAAQGKSYSTLSLEFSIVKDFLWIAIAIPCISASCFAPCCLIPFLKKFFELGVETRQQPTVELVEVMEEAT